MVRLSSSRSSFPAVVEFSKSASKEGGEIGRDERPRLLKMSSSVRICIVSGDGGGRGRGGRSLKIGDADGGFADIRRSWDGC